MHNLKNRPWFKHYQQNANIEITEIPLYRVLEQSVLHYGDKTAIIFENEKTTYLELKDQVDRLAGGLQEMGFQKGERIGLMLSNHPDYIICYYAAQALGLTVVQINPMYTARELLQIVNDSQVSYIVGDPLSRKTILEVNELYQFRYIIGSQFEVGNSEGCKTLDELIPFSAPIDTPAEIDVHEDIAVIQYTGGTSGKTKGAMLTHYNLVANVIQSFNMYNGNMISGEETILTATPLYHVYAMTSAMNLGIYIGARILLFRKFDVNKVLENIKKYRPTFFPGVPKMYISFVNHPGIEQYGLNCLKTCSSGSAPLPVEVIKRFEELTGATIGEGFGLSEASPSTHRNPPFGIRKVASIGIPMPETDCMIIDENKNELGPKCVGELLIKGPQIMKGYWNNEEETAAALQNGWLYTGDLAMMDDDGYFYIVGRKKEMIIVGGFNIYPQEVEGVLYEHPDIQEAAVAGIPDEEHGELVKAYVVPKSGREIDIDELKGYCYSKLTPYKVPKMFEVRRALPRNTVGKLLKRLLVKEELEKGEKNNAE
ncbi:long-chain acyl-CoA synthetase [Cytobacillus oceanisediminis]|uniref:Long-chain acyl-CoA synthetase n=1 Tax=Cytobacillus oceanisediminis TaxID=665099 RepID=A0A2V2ZRL8_9BACI|nr:long-chain fatty acid--CoA ligase [Cytobacillus oceanisediminis]PWW26979.1 long-chain acyl-CoA synthetase [Cytobacillus oceanisediminis]